MKKKDSIYSAELIVDDIAIAGEGALLKMIEDRRKRLAAEGLFDAARKHGTFMGEAFMYRHHPHTQIVIDLVKSGVIGEVRMVKSNFGFALPKFAPEHRLFANDLAGGGIIDIGGYPVSMSRLIAGAVAGKSFLDPVETLGVAHLGAQGTDEWAAAVLKFDNEIIGGAVGNIVDRVRLGHRERANVRAA